jgi:hypothetical protein
MALRHRIQMYKKKESIARINGSPNPATTASIPKKKSRAEYESSKIREEEQDDDAV